MNSSRVYIFLIIFMCSLLMCNCKNEDKTKYEWRTRKVIATAYNSLAYQTSADPHITAFGDSLKPGLLYIAVSRNLLREGLKHNSLVKIEGLEGTYLVKDKMNKRWLDRIDIYMGTDVKAARQWGKRKVNISYRVEIVDDSLTSK